MATSFPFTLTTINLLKSSALSTPRFNFKNDGTYSMSTIIQTTSNANNCTIQGYSSTPGDGGRATIDASGTAITMWSNSSANVAFADLIFSNSAASGTNDNITDAGSTSTYIRCVSKGARGCGFNINDGIMIECEAYGNNTPNTATIGSRAGFNAQNNVIFIRCIAHDNAGSNTRGFESNGNHIDMINCISDTNGNSGAHFQINGGNSRITVVGCDFYNNGSDGFTLDRNANTMTNAWFENCNFIKNTGFGINNAATTAQLPGGYVFNCGYGAGSQVNVGGDSALVGLIESGKVTYASGLTPWVDPANGDFRINIGSSFNAGRGAFTQTAASYAGTVGYPDIGAAEHRDSQKASTFGG